MSEASDWTLGSDAWIARATKEQVFANRVLSRLNAARSVVLKYRKGVSHGSGYELIDWLSRRLKEIEKEMVDYTTEVIIQGDHP